jgi:RNA polymerase sigma-70 factor (family 1)
MSSYPSYSDYQLILLLKQDDKHAFAEIYNRYQTLLFVYALKKMRDDEGAKDVIQEVFVSLWNVRVKFNEQISIGPYLYRSVLNRVLNVFRNNGVTQEYISSLQHTLDSREVISADYLIREKDIATMIELEISLLPVRMREIFELRRKSYMSNKEIAKELNISEHTVATQMKNALKILRKKLGSAIFSIYFLHL